MDIVVLACSRQKYWDRMSHPAYIAAKHAYTGYVFTSGREYCESNGYKYYILSGKHGLIEPDRRIKNYDSKLCSKVDVSLIRNLSKNLYRNLHKKRVAVYLIGGNSYYRYFFHDLKGKKYYLKSKRIGDLKSKAKKLRSEKQAISKIGFFEEF